MYASNTKPIKAAPKQNQQKEGTRLEDIQKVQSAFYKNFTFSKTQDVFSCNVLPRPLICELIDKATDQLLEKKGTFAHTLIL